MFNMLRDALSTLSVKTVPARGKREQGCQTLPLPDVIPPVKKPIIKKSSFAKSTRAVVPNDRMPIEVLRMLESHGLIIPGRCGLWTALKEMGGESNLWDLFLEHIDDLAGVPVDIALKPILATGDPIFISPRNADGSKGPNHWLELEFLLKDLSGLAVGAPAVYPCRFKDAAVAIPQAVAHFKNPPTSCVGAQLIPQGAYVASLILYFANLTMSIRIHRNSQ